MPGMTGVEFLKQVKELYPDTVRIVLSGYSEASAIESAVNEGQISRFLSKPWNDDDLKASIAQSLEQLDLRRQNAQLTDKIKEQNEELKSLNEDLENRVEQRTRELAQSQKILEFLPRAVMGVDEEKDIVYMNKAAREMIGGGNAVNSLGSPIGKVVNPEVCAVAEKALADCRTHVGENIEWNNKRLQVTCGVVDPEHAFRGVTIILEEAQHACR
jgi:transcriptional regulator with PAS, ATPase and Fis domain